MNLEKFRKLVLVHAIFLFCQRFSIVFSEQEYSYSWHCADWHFVPLFPFQSRQSFSLFITPSWFFLIGARPSEGACVNEKISLFKPDFNSGIFSIVYNAVLWVSSPCPPVCSRISFSFLERCPQHCGCNFMTLCCQNSLSISPEMKRVYYYNRDVISTHVFPLATNNGLSIVSCTLIPHE